jgi:hypothetical protein
MYTTWTHGTDDIFMLHTSMRMMPEEDAGGSALSAATAALSCPTASCGADVAGSIRVSCRLTTPRSPAPAAQPFMAREQDGRSHRLIYMCTQGKLPYQYVNTGCARLKKGKLRRVEVTPTSLAVDAVREGRRRPE